MVIPDIVGVVKKVTTLASAILCLAFRAVSCTIISSRVPAVVPSDEARFLTTASANQENYDAPLDRADIRVPNGLSKPQSSTTANRTTRRLYRSSIGVGTLGILATLARLAAQNNVSVDFPVIKEEGNFTGTPDTASSVLNVNLNRESQSSWDPQSIWACLAGAITTHAAWSLYTLQKRTPAVDEADTLARATTAIDDASADGAARVVAATETAATDGAARLTDAIDGVTKDCAVRLITAIETALAGTTAAIEATTTRAILAIDGASKGCNDSAVRVAAASGAATASAIDVEAAAKDAAAQIITAIEAAARAKEEKSSHLPDNASDAGSVRFSAVERAENPFTPIDEAARAMFFSTEKIRSDRLEKLFGKVENIAAALLVLSKSNKRNLCMSLGEACSGYFETLSKGPTNIRFGDSRFIPVTLPVSIVDQIKNIPIDTLDSQEFDHLLHKEVPELKNVIINDPTNANNNPLLRMAPVGYPPYLPKITHGACFAANGTQYALNFTQLETAFISAFNLGYNELIISLLQAAMKKASSES